MKRGLGERKSSETTRAGTFVRQARTPTSKNLVGARGPVATEGAQR